MAEFIFENMDFNTCFRLSGENPERFIKCYYSNVKIFPGIFPTLEDVMRHLVLCDQRFKTLDWHFFQGKKYDMSKLKRLLRLNNFTKDEIEHLASIFAEIIESFEL